MTLPTRSGSHAHGYPVAVGASLLLVMVMCGAAGEEMARPDPDADPTADTGTMVITSDSSAYCRTLSGLLEAHGTLPREVRELKAQGDGLCEMGRVRGGIARLRRALLVLHKNPS